MEFEVYHDPEEVGDVRKELRGLKKDGDEKEMAKISDTYATESNLLSVKIAVSEKIIGKNLTIATEETQEFTDKNKVVLGFGEIDKQMALNKTNATLLADAFGDESENWIGKHIQIVKGKTPYQGAMVDSLQVVPIEEEPTD